MTSSLGAITAPTLSQPTSAQVAAAQAGQRFALQRMNYKGICTLTWQGQVFHFRTNPNSIDLGEFDCPVICPNDVALVRLPAVLLGWKWFRMFVNVKNNWAPIRSL